MQLLGRAGQSTDDQPVERNVLGGNLTTSVHVDAPGAYMPDMPDLPDTLPPVPDKVARAQRRVKPVSRKGDKFERIRSLKCYDDVHDMITTGWPLAEIAKYIQGTKKEYKDVEELSLIYILQAYRRSLPASTLVKRLPRAFEKASQEVRDGLDVLAELSKLFEIQMERVGIDHALEKAAKKLIPSMTQEVREARSILTDIQKMKMDLGLDERHLGTLQLDSGASEEVQTRYGKSSVRRVLEDPTSSRKVLSLVERFVQVSSTREDLDAMPEEDEEEALLLDDTEEAEFEMTAPAPGEDA